MLSVLRLFGLTIVILLLTEVVLRYAVTSPIHYVYHPGIGYTYAAEETIFGTDEGLTHIKTNNLGLNDRDVTPPVTGQKRVLVLGDSLTAGLQVPQDKTFTAITRQLLPDIDLLNAGMAGMSPANYQAMNHLAARVYQPNLHLLVINLSDYPETIYNILDHDRLTTSKNGQISLRSELALSEPPSFLKTLFSWSQHSALLTRLIQMITRQPLKIPAPNAPQNTRPFPLKESLRLLLEPLKPAVILYLPILKYLPDGQTENVEMDLEFEALVADVANDLDIPILQPRTYLQRDYAKNSIPANGFHNSSLRLGGHFNTYGHNLIAQYLAVTLPPFVREAP